MSTENETAPQKKIISRQIVRVELRPDGSALVLSKDGNVAASFGAGFVGKRFGAGERTAYFRSELDADGILEIGDRIPTPAEGW